MRSFLRAAIAKARKLSAVMAGPIFSTCATARSESPLAWSRVAVSSAIRFLSEGSLTSITPFSIAS
ncbi:MAG: hypothetical protein U1E37_13165 [Sphingomonadaceae bacterium]